MTVRFYDTQAQALREFAPLDPSNVTMYVCGPTVQSGPGIHHLRAALAFDLMRRWLVRRWIAASMGCDADGIAEVDASARSPRA